ncbi:putative phenylalanyl-tRNA synthetase beta subunit [Diplocarpon rosae]|nr:putative phenylalanyl-tRNA synthetase beta subunit [Diplocarpon rosae]
MSYNTKTNGKGKIKAFTIQNIPTPVPASFITALPIGYKPTTIFPKITGNVKDIESRYRVDNRKPGRDRAINILKDNAARKIEFVGTAKLHGTHMDIVINSNNTIRLQSRNQGVLDEISDQTGFAVAMFQQEQNILSLKKRILAQWTQINPGGYTPVEAQVVIAGEWVGPGIQKNVALASLPMKYFVITSISVNGTWVDDQLFAGIEDAAAGIIHVARGGFFRQTLDVAKKEEVCADGMMAPTMEVAARCPFAAMFKIEGKGEGIVWKAAQPLGKDPRFWLKTKGPEFAVTNTGALPKPVSALLESMGTPADRKVATRLFAHATVTPARLTQCYQILSLQHRLTPSAAARSAFCQWIHNDIWAEEKLRMEDCGVDEAYLKQCVRWVAEEWYGKFLLEEKGKVEDEHGDGRGLGDGGA